MKKLSIKQRVTLWYTIFMVLTAVLSMTTIYLNGQRQVRSYYRTTMVSAAQLAADDIRVENGELKVDKNLDSLPSVQIALLDEDGAPLYGQDRFAIDRVAGKLRNAEDHTGMNWYVYDSRLRLENGDDIWLRCSMPAAGVGILQSIGLEMLIILPAIILLAVIGGNLITKHAFRPVKEIIRTAESIADGDDLGKRIAIGTARDELYDLSQVFNEMFDRLEHSFERERRFTSDAAHELRTPITAILTQADFALSEHASDADRLEALEDIHQRAEQMSGQVRSLLSLSRMDAGQTRLIRENVDLTELAEMVTLQLEDEAEKRNISLIRENDDPVFARFDQTMILQALLNLVGNAIKYGREGGHVRIRVTKTADTVRAAVRDDGPGIPEKDVPMIFERFFQGDRSHHRDGAGLGLPLVMMIAKIHSGTVEFHNNEEGGCTFTLVLPLTDMEKDA